MRKNSKLACLIYAIFASLLTAGVHAELINRGNGLIADTVLGITWMQDASLFETLCEASDPIATEFVPVDEANARILCHQDGRMTWNDAGFWIDRLNEVAYKGYSDWRLAIVDTNPLCHENCDSVEMAHLVYVSLGNLHRDVEPCDEYDGIGGFTAKNINCIKSRGLFYNINPDASYWSGTVHPDYGDFIYVALSTGNQNSDNAGNHYYVWPVRNGLSPIDTPSKYTRQQDLFTHVRAGYSASIP
jgi:hypothetical protein